jgi:hypothetical protein
MNDIQKYCLIALGLIVFVSLIGGGGGKRTDGVYESAMSKIDSGRPLNDREQQRISDIVNWCSTHNRPIRECNH